MHVDQSVRIQPSVHGHVGCFRVPAVVSGARAFKQPLETLLPLVWVCQEPLQREVRETGNSCEFPFRSESITC